MDAGMEPDPFTLDQPALAKRDLVLRAPLMNAAGTLGFAPDARAGVAWGRFGAFVTNPVSPGPRRPAGARACLPYPGGFLLHTGWPNPGLRAVLRENARRWADSPLPVIVHLLAGAPDEAARMAARLEGLEGVAGIELGLPPGASGAEARALVEAAAGELPVIACLPLERAGELAGWLRGGAASAVSLAAPRGTLPDGRGGLVSGRLYGPGVLPQALAAVRAARSAGLPVYAAGGAYHPADVKALLAAGAAAVQLDAVLWGVASELWGD